MRVRVERYVASQIVREAGEPVDPELGAEDALEGEAPDARARKAGEVSERSAAEARRAGYISHDERAILPAARANGTG